MWGTLLFHRGFLPCLRFIPTHVGNTCRASYPLSLQTVHPHACGEHDMLLNRAALITGSSPRMWGTRKADRCSDPGNRFIPTHVGNTLRHTHIQFILTVHPHACGEHDYSKAGLLNILGSSPRMWGTLIHCGAYFFIIRFIPTHVGNTKVPADRV